MKKELIINNVSFGCPKMTDRDDENLAFFAPDCLNVFYRFNHIVFLEAVGLDAETATSIGSVHAALPYVAKFYNLNKDELLKSWVKNHGMGYCFNS